MNLVIEPSIDTECRSSNNNTIRKSAPALIRESFTSGDEMETGIEKIRDELHLPETERNYLHISEKVNGVKKRKVSLTRSFKQSMKSFASMTHLAQDEQRPKINQNDSLLLQLHYVSSNASSEVNENEDKACMSSSRKRRFSKIDQNPQASENGYGWFVELDYEQSTTFASSSAENKDLAFQAIIAPKQSHLDRELDWACAADTVDDVLQDFF